MRTQGTVLGMGAAALLGIWTAGCAGPSMPGTEPTPERGYTAASVDVAPKLIQCNEPRVMMPSSISGDRVEAVTLRYVVEETGHVDPDWIVVVDSKAWQTGGAASASAIDEAKLRAESCRYESGTMGDQAVRVVTDRTFRIAITP